jgi:hypothetical protein
MRDLLGEVSEGDLLSKVLARGGEIQVWPPRMVDGLLALAQHYGLPTRLLDWTRSPYHAAYFAAKGALQDYLLENGGGRERLAVWSVDALVLKLNGYFKHKKQRIETVSVAGASNPNLHAQRGLFTVIRTELSHYDEDFDRLPLNAQYSRMVEHRGERLGPEKAPFTLVTLPQKLAPQLARNLSKLGVTGSTVFPGFQGAANRLSEKASIVRGLRKHNEGE